MDDELHRDINVLAPAERIASHPEIWDDLDEADFNLILETDWSLFARPEQRTPPGGWYIWLILAGRGWGKTRTGAQDIALFALRNPNTISAVVAGNISIKPETLREQFMKEAFKHTAEYDATISQWMEGRVG